MSVLGYIYFMCSLQRGDVCMLPLSGFFLTSQALPFYPSTCVDICVAGVFLRVCMPSVLS